ncbi:MAG TPA: hypothetical protein ENF43_03625, partial [Thermoplasmatales archaeon]|nr:hypothetical protein [Thermoplasmatales archaeon]
MLYGIDSGALDNREYDSNFVSNHTVILNNLLPGTLYEFKVESKDRAGNSVQSRVKFFRTLPEEDKNKPSLYITLPPKLKGNVKLAPLVSDDKGVSRVSLFIDDKLFMTDYTFPYEFIINTKGFDDGLHRFEIRAWDFSGNVVFQGLESFIENTLFDHPTVRIISPSENERIDISTDEEVDIIAEIDHTGDLDIDRIEVLIDDNVVYTEQGRTLCSSSFEEGLSHCVYFPWSCNGSLPTNFVYQLRANLIVTGGEHKIKVIAYDTEGYYGSDEINVVSYVPEWVRPVLIPVYRYEFNPQGTYIHAEVSVYNAGNWPAKDIYLIIDQPMSPGFIITNSSERMQSTLIFGTDCTFHQQVVVTKDNLDTRATWRLSFDLIPIMTENPSSDSYIFINNLTVRYNWEGNEGTTGDYTIHPREDLTNIVQCLTGNSRYLIITNFEDMFDAPSSSSDGFCYATYTGEEGELVTNIGELALLRRGVVGNVRRGTTNTTIKNLISPSGEWARRLSQSFTSPLQGYVLIVGESNIVPSWTITGLNVQWAGGATTPQVDLSDLKYADISDDDLPDLVVGRIIGDNIEDLNRLIMTDIEVAKNMNRITGTKALILAGSEDTMKNAVDDLQSDLSSMYADIVKLNYSDYDNKSDRIDAFLDNTRDRSLIVYDGHGSVSSWQFYNTVSPDPDFGNKNPVIFSFACTTGRYRESNQNLFSLGEKFFNSNASLFIGSTESSAVSLNNEATINFFENYFDLGNLSVGEMLTNYKRDMDIKSKYRKLWVLEYNLYGDPLLGKSSPATLMVIGESGDEDLGEEIEIDLPNYNKTKKGEFDYIDIPKGSVSTATDKPRVPIFIYKKDIKKGVIVQNVYLKERNKVIEESGVNLPVVEMRPAQYSTLSNKIELNSSNSWYPEEDFRWTFTKNPDGTGTLKIVIFPLFYNQSEKKIRYYKYYKFSIEWIESGITVEDLKVKNRVNLNEEALISFKVKNSGEEK